MTNWLPDLSQGHGPLYLRLAERIEADISDGRLAPGAKLPPQRNLAYDIGVTIGTVTRAYAVARQRGLVSGEVGRGTYVLGSNETGPREAIPADLNRLPAKFDQLPRPGKLRMDSTSAPDLGQSAIIRDAVVRIAAAHPEKIGDYTREVRSEWRKAGRQWLATDDWAPDARNVVPTLGCHAAIMAVIAVATAPGDRIAFEHLTYSSISRSANLIGRRSVAFGNDENGADPEDFERLCAQQHPKLVFLMPALQNPTLSTMPMERMKAIAEIARKYNVSIIEDSIYGTLMDPKPASIAALAPERTFHVGGLSKAVSAGVRGGWVACPTHFAPRVQTAHKMVTGGIPFMLAELAADLVASGEADRLRGAVRRELVKREALARKVFDGLEFRSHPHAPYLWIKLPEPWVSATFKQVAADEGVLIDDEDEYKPGRSERVFHRIRVGFSIPRTTDEVAHGFAILRRLLDHGEAGYDSYG
ncbi:MAG: PLP-dependent aminotransferase family protein [Rhizobiaceae bacterium]|nr:PLP-dependent aminotransferase family protein [Rhizobiaceae bacterium]